MSVTEANQAAAEALGAVAAMFESPALAGETWSSDQVAALLRGMQRAWR